MLKTVHNNMTSYNGFKWKKRGIVTCPDWKDTAECGNGLHGLPMGIGNSSFLLWNTSAKWIVFEALGGYIELNGKAKCESAKVLFCGDRKGATDYLVKHGADISKVVGAFQSGGDWSQLTGGDMSHLTGGEGSHLKGGDWSHLTGGKGSHLTGGDVSHLTGEEGSHLTGGEGSHLKGGDWSHLTGGKGSKLTGEMGSVLSGGKGSALIFLWWDGNCQRVVVGYVEKKGLLPNVKYRLSQNHQIVPVEETEVEQAAKAENSELRHER